MNKIDGYARTVRELLNGKKFGIDYYQREYKWTRRQIDELLKDLSVKFLESFSPEHERTEVESYGHYFLGSIIISHKNNRNYIIDGQQRLTSLTLLLIFLHRLQQGRPDEIDVKDLIFSEKYGKRSFNLDVEDRNACMEALFSGQPFDSAEKSESVQNINARYDTIEELFPEELRGEALPYFIDWLLENVHLVEITAYSDEDAYTIFETMNDRGLSLSLPDMLKGYLLSSINSEEKKTSANDLWKKRIKELADLGKEEDADFFKDWLRAKYAQSVRERKRNAVNQDYERIGTEFHRWVREKRELIGLNRSVDYELFVERDLDFYARQYTRIHRAAESPVSGLESVYYNAHRGFTLQTQVLLAPLMIEDDDKTLEAKLRLVADYIDIYLARRVWNWRSISYSNQSYSMFLLMREVRNLSVKALSELLLRKLEEEEQDFSANQRFRRHQQNQFQVHHVLARLTYHIEAECGIASTFQQYVDKTIRKPYEIEHIWANHYDRHADEFDNPVDFEEFRNLIGGLMLIPRGFNQSYGDATYEEKLPEYNAQNLLARSLHESCYKHNPSFLAFLKRSGLPFAAHSSFKREDLLARQDLYRQIAEEIWNPKRLVIEEAE